MGFAVGLSPRAPPQTQVPDLDKTACRSLRKAIFAL